MEAEDVRCPVCGGRGVPIVYGYRAYSSRKPIVEKEVVIGGCLPSDDSVSCLQGGATW